MIQLIKKHIYQLHCVLVLYAVKRNISVALNYPVWLRSTVFFLPFISVSFPIVRNSVTMETKWNHCSIRLNIENVPKPYSPRALISAKTFLRVNLNDHSSFHCNQMGII